MRNRIIFILSALGLFNIIIWILAIGASHNYPILLGLVTLAYGLGLRHAVDADHIAAIDNTIRKLIQDGQKPVGVGLFFSLGHSTIVILLSILVSFSASYIKENLPQFQETGSLIGTSVSSLFLLVIGIINFFVFISIYKQWKIVSKGGKYKEITLNQHLENRGILTRLLKPLLKSIKNSWNMYFVGFLFGLGFDTATEIGILSISAATGASGIPIQYIILIPLAFTAAMTLVDTLDGILMLGAYGWAQIKPVRKLYYNMNITFISVVIALFLGGIEAMQLFIEKMNLEGGFFNLISGLDFTNMGYFIIGIFILSFLGSALVYKIQGYDLL